jgi:hypothetical protein
MDDTTDTTGFYREQILRHAGPIITGRFVGFQTAYTREVRLGQPLLVVVFAAARIAQAVGALVLTVLRAGSGRGGGRSFKDLKKAPEFLVTPVRLRDDLGQVYEIELHGHLPQSALRRGDLVQVRTLAQRDPRMPVRLQQLINLTTLTPYTPRIPTLWSHLGPALLLQAFAGLFLVGLLMAAWLR